jgi:hypothetical protein
MAIEGVGQHSLNKTLSPRNTIDNQKLLTEIASMNIGKATRLPTTIMYEFTIEFYLLPYLSEMVAAINEESGPKSKFIKALIRAYSFANSGNFRRKNIGSKQYGEVSLIKLPHVTHLETGLFLISLIPALNFYHVDILSSLSSISYYSNV